MQKPPTTKTRAKAPQKFGLMNLGIFFASLLFTFTDQSIMIVLANYLPKIVGDSSTLYGLASSMSPLSTFFFSLFITRISGKYGRKSLVLIGTGLVGFATFLLYFADLYWTILSCRFIIGVTCLSPLMTALIHDQYPEDKRGVPLGLSSGALVIGFLLSSVLGGILYTMLGDFTVFLLLGIFPLVSMFIILVTLPKDHKKEGTEEKLGKIRIGKLVVHIIRKKDLLGCHLMAFLASICFGGAGSYAIYMIFVYFGIPANQGGLYLLAPTLIEIITFFIIGSIVKNFTKYFRILTIISIITGLAIPAILRYTDSFLIFVIAMAIAGYPIASIVQASDTITLNHIPEERKSEIIALYRMVTHLGYFIGPALFGALVDFIWPYLPGMITLLSGALCAWIYWGLVKRKNNKH